MVIVLKNHLVVQVNVAGTLVSLKRNLVYYAGEKNLIKSGYIVCSLRTKGGINTIARTAVCNDPALLVKTISVIHIRDTETEVRNIVLTGNVGIKAEFQGQFPRTFIAVVTRVEIRSAPIPTAKLSKVECGLYFSLGAITILNLTDCVDLRDNSIDCIICCERRYCHT